MGRCLHAVPGRKGPDLGSLAQFSPHSVQQFGQLCFSFFCMGQQTVLYVLDQRSKSLAQDLNVLGHLGSVLLCSGSSIGSDLFQLLDQLLPDLFTVRGHAGAQGVHFSAHFVPYLLSDWKQPLGKGVQVLLGLFLQLGSEWGQFFLISLHLLRPALLETFQDGTDLLFDQREVLG
ncbi:hypothetical protein FKM82_025960 [Ascaphus truei]